MNRLAQLYASIQSAMAGAERVFETIDEVPELLDAPDPDRWTKPDAISRIAVKELVDTEDARDSGHLLVQKSL